MKYGTALWAGPVIAGLISTGIALAQTPGGNPFTSPDASWPASYMTAPGLDGSLLRSDPPAETPAAYDAPPSAPLALAPDLGAIEPLITITVNGVTRGYPMHIVAAHRIVNDEIGGVPVAVTYCRVCSSAMAFRREVAGAPANLRLAGLSYDENIILYDEKSRTWWQQINGFGLAGPHRDDELQIVPSRLESWAAFRKRAAGARNVSVILPSELSKKPLSVYQTVDFSDDAGRINSFNPTDRVLVVGRDAWPLALLRQVGRVETKDLLIVWEPGRAAAPDAFGHDAGKDIGAARVYHRTGDAMLETDSRVQLLHAFFRFNDGGKLHLENDGKRID